MEGGRRVVFEDEFGEFGGYHGNHTVTAVTPDVVHRGIMKPGRERVSDVTERTYTASYDMERLPTSDDSVTSDNVSLDSGSVVDSEAERKCGPPVTSGAAAAAAAVKVAHLANEYERLSDWLELLGPEQVKDVLLKRLDQKERKSLVALGMLFPRGLFPAQHAHCARCHVVYDTLDPQPGRCALPHRRCDVTLLHRDPRGAEFHCRACQRDFRLDRVGFYDEEVAAYLTEPCFHGNHTSLPAEVDFRGPAEGCDRRGCLDKEKFV